MIDIYQSLGLQQPNKAAEDSDRQNMIKNTWQHRLRQRAALAVWKTAVSEAKFRFEMNNWTLNETQLMEDHIRFLGTGVGADFVLCLFACRDQDKKLLSREYFLSLSAAPKNEGKRVFILYTRVIKAESMLLRLSGPDDTRFKSKILLARDIENPEESPAVWMIERCDGRTILTPYAEQKKAACVDRLIAAFNREDFDLVNSMLTKTCREQLPYFTFIDARDSYEFFEILHKLRGKLRPAYIRMGEYSFIKTACLESGRCLTPILDENGLIERFSFEGTGEYREILVLDETPTAHPLNMYPKLRSFRCIPHRRERFCLELTFENGEVKEYTLPTEEVGDEVALVDGYCFTDRIFFYARLVDSSPDPDQRVYLDMHSRGQRIVFANGYSISTPELYYGYPDSFFDSLFV